MRRRTSNLIFTAAYHNIISSTEIRANIILCRPFVTDISFLVYILFARGLSFFPHYIFYFTLSVNFSFFWLAVCKYFFWPCNLKLKSGARFRILSTYERNELFSPAEKLSLGTLLFMRLICAFFRFSNWLCHFAQMCNFLYAKNNVLTCLIKLRTVVK